MSRMSRKRVTGSAACCAAALLILPACSSDGDGKDKVKDRTGGVGNLSAREISDKAKQELLDAKSVHISMRATGSDATKDTDSDTESDSDADTDSDSDDPASMELTLDRDGNCVGSMKMANGAALELVKRGDKVWVKPDEKFWKTQVPGGEGEAAAEIFKNRYVHGTTSDVMLREVSEVCDLRKVQKEIEDDSDDATKSLAKGEPTTLDGTDVIPLTGKDDGKETTLYVATEGKPYLLKAVEKGDGDDTTTTFSDYDKPVPSKTPSADESVDVSKLQRQLQKI
ncbi:putative lipoprotein [Streptomyces formicae]|uniref:Putative lipoprotein n=2 Tax=Streptomyces formicae TaxID=1616117 RepID=A0A291QEK1_9ACTN|nr:putative lipoprotein [Streptomyces formicae]